MANAELIGYAITVTPPPEDEFEVILRNSGIQDVLKTPTWYTIPNGQVQHASTVFQGVTTAEVFSQAILNTTHLTSGYQITYESDSLIEHEVSQIGVYSLDTAHPQNERDLPIGETHMISQYHN